MRTSRHDLIRPRDAFLRILRVGEIVQRHSAAEADRQVVLRNLVVLGHVRVEIIFPVELADGRDLALEHQSRKRRQAQRIPVHDGKRPRQPETDRAGMRIRLRAEFHPAPAEHLAPGLQLHMHFQPDGGEVFHPAETLHRFPGFSKLREKPPGCRLLTPTSRATLRRRQSRPAASRRVAPDPSTAGRATAAPR